MAANVSTASTPEVANSAVASLEIVQSIVQAYIVPLLGLIGMATNVISIFVFFKYRNKDSSNIQYLMFLSIIDFMNCGYDFATQFILHGVNALSNNQYGFDIVLDSVFMCKFLRFLVQWLRLMSVYALVMYSLERCLAVNIPLKVASIFTSSKRKRALVVLIILSFFASFKTLIMYNLYEERGFLQCYLDPIYSTDLRLFVSCFELTLINVIPCILITVFNCMICYALFRRKSQKADLTSDGNKGLSGAELKCILNLFGISALYVVTSLPHIILWTLFNTYVAIESAQQTKLDVDWDLIFQSAKLSDSILVIGFAANFLIYALSLDWYRQEITGWCCPGKVTGKGASKDGTTKDTSVY